MTNKENSVIIPLLNGKQFAWTSDVSLIFENGVYYMFAQEYSRQIGRYLYCVRSSDLKNWSDPVVVSRLNDLIPVLAGEVYSEIYWAPDVFKYKGKFYIIASYYDIDDEHFSPQNYIFSATQRKGHRTTVILRSDTIDGNYQPISKNCVSSVNFHGLPEYEERLGHITPAGQDAIDGSFYLDPQGQPWLIWSDEGTNYTHREGGCYAYARLSDDLTRLTSEPKKLFAVKTINGFHYCSDAGFIYTAANGDLLCVWTTYDIPPAGTRFGPYCVMVSRKRGAIDDESAEWEYEGYLYNAYDENMSVYDRSDIYNDGKPYLATGGHANIFKSGNGQLYLTLHLNQREADYAHSGSLKKPAFIALKEVNGKLVWGLKDE